MFLPRTSILKVVRHTYSMSTTAEDMRFPGSHALGFIGGVSTTQLRMDEGTKEDLN